MSKGNKNKAVAAVAVEVPAVVPVELSVNEKLDAKVSAHKADILFHLAEIKAIKAKIRGIAKARVQLAELDSLIAGNATA